MKAVNKIKRFVLFLVLFLCFVLIISSVQWFIRESKRTYINTELKNKNYTEIDVSGMEEEEIETLMGGGE